MIEFSGTEKDRAMLQRRSLGLALATLAIAPRARAETPPESTFDRVRRTHVVRVGAVGGQAPYCTRDLASGEWRGFIPDFGRDLAKALDAKAEFVETNWGNAVLDLQADKVDIFFGLNPTPQRAGDRLHPSVVQQPVHLDRAARLPPGDVGGDERALCPHRAGDRYFV
jgi:ABC-type amino acid transport substrate-binding protein